MDPLLTDNEPDKEYPAGLAPVVIESGGDTLLGVLFQAQGRGPHPVIVLLHGFPGNERNFDLAHVFRRAGWHVLVFHYRGAWGSSGTFSFTHVLQDVESALTFLRVSSLQYRMIPEKIVLIGHSMGGFAALMTAAVDPTVYAAASLAGVNMGYFAQIICKSTKKAAAQFFEEGLPPLQGTSAEDLLDELRVNADSWDLLQYVNVLSACPILLIGGSRDKTAPIAVHYWPLVNALGNKNTTHWVLDADHLFSDKRITFARTVLSWLSHI